uniref:Phospholipase A2 domain-containing protein n=1 Tax=Eutreptiella gymnastica TaxID=73025 RepID=A0A7S1IIH2_9EUGL
MADSGVPNTGILNPSAGHFTSWRRRVGTSEKRAEGRRSVQCQAPRGLVPKPGYTLSANGCGPAGMQVKEKFGLYKCCNRHDVCYGVCGTTHGFCEQQFTGCMAHVCNDFKGKKRQECLDQAQSFSGMTMMMGQGIHEQSQREACDCVDGEEQQSRWRNTIMDLFKSAKPEDATEETVQKMVNEHKRQEGKMYFNLMTTYGKDLIDFQGIDSKL